MEMLSPRGSVAGSSDLTNTLHGESVEPVLQWTYSKEDDYTLKRRQRRQRLNRVHCYVARSGVAAVAASASMFTRQVEHMARGEAATARGPDSVHATLCSVAANLKTSLACTLGGAVARLCELASGLAAAIGEPPQRVLARSEGQDAPLALLWALNLCALCTLASLAFFVVSFSSPPHPADPSPELEASDRLQFASALLSSGGSGAAAPADSKRPASLGRVLIVLILSLTWGCGLGLRHPLKSALLCGF